MLHKKRRHSFTKLKAEWETISTDISLFGSWCWCSAWWKTWAESCGLELQLYSFHKDNGAVVAITPFFLSQKKTRLGYKLKQLQVFGGIYPTDITVLSEYTDLPLDSEYESEVETSLNQLLENIDWDEFALPFSTDSSFLFRYLQSNRSKFRYLHVQREGSGIAIDTSGSFDEYLADLGKNTRLKLYNRRKLLETLAEVEVEYADASNIDAFLSELNSLDRPRWGRDCFGSQSLAFHAEVAMQASERNELMLSRLKVDGEVVSILYNIRFNGAEYNIQSAYRQDYHPKISLGTLHLGYAIEQAFKSEKTQVFDLLYGEGKNSFYKKRLGGKETDFYTLVCGKTYKALLVYRLQMLINWIKRSIR